MVLIIFLKIMIYYVKKWNEYIFICNLFFFIMLLLDYIFIERIINIFCVGDWVLGFFGWVIECKIFWIF